ncbi:MAG: hypothetical protein L6R35_000627 [Caloplaca aegaea]|nr:MAG: hypothetical protein L6R35_000627 [Caloplaca aegaea]
MAGNAWVNNDRGNREVPQQGSAQDQHVSVNGFNTQDARNLLKNGVWTLRFCSEDAALTYQQVSAQNTRRQPIIRLLQVQLKAPDPGLPNSMGNGKDFFLELRKQLTSLQQHGSERAGG